MTHQPELVEAVCACCGTVYTTLYRPRLRLEIEPWTEEKIEQDTTVTCPECGHEDALETLIVGPHPAYGDL